MITLVLAYSSGLNPSRNVLTAQLLYMKLGMNLTLSPLGTDGPTWFSSNICPANIQHGFTTFCQKPDIGEKAGLPCPVHSAQPASVQVSHIPLQYVTDLLACLAWGTMSFLLWHAVCRLGLHMQMHDCSFFGQKAFYFPPLSLPKFLAGVAPAFEIWLLNFIFPLHCVSWLLLSILCGGNSTASCFGIFLYCLCCRTTTCLWRVDMRHSRNWAGCQRAMSRLAGGETTTGKEAICFLVLSQKIPGDPVHQWFLCVPGNSRLHRSPGKRKKWKTYLDI